MEVLLCGKRGKPRLETIVACLTAPHMLNLCWTNHHLIFTAGNCCPHVAPPCMIHCRLYYSWGTFKSSNSQTAGDAFMSSEKNQFKLRGLSSSFSRYFARRLLVGRSRLENSELHLMRLTGVSSCFCSLCWEYEGVCVATAETLMHKHAQQHTQTEDKIG